LTKIDVFKKPLVRWCCFFIIKRAQIANSVPKSKCTSLLHKIKDLGHGSTISLILSENQNDVINIVKFSLFNPATARSCILPGLVLPFA
jgi:hypothetical protein